MAPHGETMLIRFYGLCNHAYVIGTGKEIVRLHKKFQRIGIADKIPVFWEEKVNDAKVASLTFYANGRVSLPVHSENTMHDALWTDSGVMALKTFFDSDGFTIKEKSFINRRYGKAVTYSGAYEYVFRKRKMNGAF